MTTTIEDAFPGLPWVQIAWTLDALLDGLAVDDVATWAAWQAGRATGIEVVHDVDRGLVGFGPEGRPLVWVRPDASEVSHP